MNDRLHLQLQRQEEHLPSKNLRVLADMSVHVRREFVLQRAAVSGGPAEEGAQLLTRVELEGPALSSLIQVEASKAGQREPIAGAESLIHLIQHTIQPLHSHLFVGLHPVGESPDKLLLLDTFGHKFLFIESSRTSANLTAFAPRKPPAGEAAQRRSRSRSPGKPIGKPPSSGISSIAKGTLGRIAARANGYVP